MHRRSRILVGLVAVLALGGFGLPAAATLLGLDEQAPPVVEPPTSAATAATTSPVPSPPPPAVSLALVDPEEAAAVEAALSARGYVVSYDAPTRIVDVPVADADVVAVTREAYALVVHPRSPLVDVTLAEALALLSGGPTGEASLATAEAAAWLARTHPGTRTTTEGSADALLDRVGAELEAIGLLPAAALTPAVRALTVGGHDPYRDPAAASPLADQRWVSGPGAREVVAALGWDEGALLDPVGFLATGELIPARCTQQRASALDRGFDTIFDGTRELIGAADLAMSHWEPAIVEGTPTPCVQTFNLSTTPEAARATARAGVDVALAVGNHVGDCWDGCNYQEAVRQTVAHLAAAGLAVTGAGASLDEALRPAVVSSGGLTFAFLGYDDIASAFYGATAGTAGTAALDLETLAGQVRAAAAEADHVIVGFSWGVEYVAEPTARQREAARIAVEAGASLVVGNHPHWVQATEWIGDAFVAYGLGNFVFDQDWSVETTQGAVLEVGFTAERILGVRLRPTAVRQMHLVELVPPDSAEGAAILGQIWDATAAVAGR